LMGAGSALPHLLTIQSQRKGAATFVTPIGNENASYFSGSGKQSPLEGGAMFRVPRKIRVAIGRLPKPDFVNHNWGPMSSRKPWPGKYPQDPSIWGPGPKDSRSPFPPQGVPSSHATTNGEIVWDKALWCPIEERDYPGASDLLDTDSATKYTRE
jgi:hypothetical protein